MSMTYNSLSQQVQNELDRYDDLFISYIPNFINQAIDRINADAKNIGLEQYVFSAFTIGDPVIIKPGRWRRTINMNYGTGNQNNTRNQIRLRSYEFLRNYWPDSSVTAPPLYYSDYGFTAFLVAPTPDQAYPFELSYLELPQPLTLSNQTNWLTNYAPSLLLYATLLEAIIYLKNDDRIPAIDAEYQKRLTAINGQDDQRIVDRGTNRSAD